MTTVITRPHPGVADRVTGTLGPWLLLGAAVGAACVIFRGGIGQMLHIWSQRPDYRHAALVLPLVAYLVWRQGRALGPGLQPGSWAGCGLVLAGLGCNLVGTFGSVYTLQHVGFMLCVIGIALVFSRRDAWSVLWLPALLILLLVPLPNFLFMNLLAQLKTASVTLATLALRLADVTVFAEGGVLTFSSLALSAEQARDGLAYVVPLTTAGVLCASLARTRLWRKALLCVGPVPLIVLANALVLFAVGVLADEGALEFARRLLRHKDAVVGTVALLALALGAFLLLRRATLAARRPTAARLQDDARAPAAHPVRGGAAPSLLATLAVLSLALVAAAAPDRKQAIPARAEFSGFPLQVGAWEGSHLQLEPQYAAALQLDDYLLADYRARHAHAMPINFYVAWYDTQQAGRSVHSPNSCLPGEGWRIVDLAQVELGVGSGTLRANRVVIELGGRRQLVYYWFQQRGRLMTNEYLLKWNLFWDGLTRHRSDGALVRVVVPLQEGTPIAEAELAAADFIRHAVPLLDPYVPR